MSVPSSPFASSRGRWPAMEQPDLDQNRPRRTRQPGDDAFGPGLPDPPRHRDSRPQAEAEEAIHELAEARLAGEAPAALEHAPRPVLEVEQMCEPPHRQHPEHDPEPLAVGHQLPRSYAGSRRQKPTVASSLHDVPQWTIERSHAVRCTTYPHGGRLA